MPKSKALPRRATAVNKSAKKLAANMKVRSAVKEAHAGAMSKPPREKLVWVEVSKDQWITHRIPEGENQTPMVKRSSTNNDGSHTFWVYRNGQALGTATELEAAKKIAEGGKMPPAQRRAAENLLSYIRDTPGDADAFEALEPVCKAEIQRTYPHLTPRSFALKKDTRIGGAPKRELLSPSDKKIKTIDELPQGTIVRLREGNPRAPGTAAHTNWESVFAHAGKTVAEFVAAKCNQHTLKNAIRAGYVKVDT